MAFCVRCLDCEFETRAETLSGAELVADLHERDTAHTVRVGEGCSKGSVYRGP